MNSVHISHPFLHALYGLWQKGLHYYLQVEVIATVMCWSTNQHNVIIYSDVWQMGYHKNTLHYSVNEVSLCLQKLFNQHTSS